MRNNFSDHRMLCHHVRHLPEFSHNWGLCQWWSLWCSGSHGWWSGDNGVAGPVSWPALSGAWSASQHCHLREHLTIIITITIIIAFISGAGSVSTRSCYHLIDKRVYYQSKIFILHHQYDSTIEIGIFQFLTPSPPPLSGKFHYFFLLLLGGGVETFPYFHL